MGFTKVFGAGKVQRRVAQMRRIYCSVAWQTRTTGFSLSSQITLCNAGQHKKKTIIWVYQYGYTGLIR